MKLASKPWRMMLLRIAGRSGGVITLLATALLLVVVPRPSVADTAILSGMPTYYWWGGCSPTAGGMIMGYWNNPNLYPLYDGDATVWSGASYNSNGSAPTGTAAMVASWEHVREGELLGYDTSTGRGHYTNSQRDANCIADFMGTDNGSTGTGVLTGLEAFAEWDNPATADVNESVEATCAASWYLFGSYDVWGDFITEIDAGRPALLNLSRSGGGHSVAAYGYTDNDGTDSDYFAVRDTWPAGLSQAPQGSMIDDGVEWWPWRPYTGSYNPEDPWDYRVDFMVTFYAEPIPEPTTLLLLLTGVGALVVRCRRSRKKS